ncbi:MAG: hypothetical protein ABI390_02065 [Daejeonella sp.]
MKEEILSHLNNPRNLELIYRGNKVYFKHEFQKIYPEIKGSLIADFWNERLKHESDEFNWGSSTDWLFVVIVSFIAGLIAKIPALFSVDQEFFYSRNIGFIVFPALSVYFIRKNNLSVQKISLIAFATVAGLVFINLFPDVKRSDTLVLSSIHLVLFLWCVLGFAFVAEKPISTDNRLNFLKYNGDLVVISALILISGAIMTGMTIGLFSLIGFKIEKFYFDYVVIFGLAAVPIIGTYLTRTNPQLVGKVSPVIARIFSPLVAVMLVIYLSAMIYSGKNPYSDRDFLMVFNALLIGVMAIIFFSVAEISKSGKRQAEIWILLILSVLTVIVNSVALSAIVFRISEWGITPNRMAVLGGNLLILINLIMVIVQLYKVVLKKVDLSSVGKPIAVFLPIYFIWTIIVTFIFPLIFNFK